MPTPFTALTTTLVAVLAATSIAGSLEIEVAAGGEHSYCFEVTLPGP